MRNLKFVLISWAVCLWLLNGAIFAQKKTENKIAETPPSSLVEYEGRYEFNPLRLGNFIADFTADGAAKLKMKLSHRQERTFEYEGKDAFADSEYSQIKLFFVRDDVGKIKGLLMQNFRFEYYADQQSNIFSSLRPGDAKVNAKKIELPPVSSVGNTEFKIKGFPTARVVAVAGSFNNWNQSKNLCFYENDAWICRIDLAPGRHTYKFIVDGAWMIDPANGQYEDDTYGNRNSVKIVEAADKK